MTSVTYLGKSYHLPDYGNPNINFEKVYQTLSVWHSGVRPEFDETVGEIGSTIDAIRIAKGQLEVNAGRLSEEEFVDYQKKADLFTTFFNRFKETQSHAHTLLGQINQGIVFLDRPPLNRVDVVTLQHLDPSIKVKVEALQGVCAKYLDELKKAQSSVTVDCQHFDKRIGDLSRPLDSYLKTVAAKGRVGYLSWGLQAISHILFNPSLPQTRVKIEAGEAVETEPEVVLRGEDREPTERLSTELRTLDVIPESPISCVVDSKKKQNGVGLESGSNLTRRQRKALARGDGH